MDDNKNYFKELANLKGIKRGKTQEDIDLEQKEFMRKRAELQNSPAEMPGAGALDSDVLRTKTIAQSNVPPANMEVISPEARKAKINAILAANKAAREAKTGIQEAEKSLDYNQLRKQMPKVSGRGLKGVLGAIPMVGGALSALASGDVSAAVPILDEADPLGPERGSDEFILEDPNATPEERRNAQMRLQARMQALQNLMNNNE